MEAPRAGPVPLGEFAHLVVGKPESLDLRWREVVGLDAWHLFDPQLLGRLPAGVTGDDDVVRVNHDRHLEAELLN